MVNHQSPDESAGAANVESQATDTTETIGNEPPFEVAGGWTHRTIKIGNSSFNLLLPADPDQVLEVHLERTSREHATSGEVVRDPYWAALWSSALPTAEAVLREDWQGHGAALELGCGMGLVGLAALARGMHVTFSDHIPEAVQLALYNADQNGFSRAQGFQLDWENLPEAPPVQRYSLILASDVLYHCGGHRPLLQTLDDLLADDGICWIGDPGRFNSREFLHVAAQRFDVRLRDRYGRFFSKPLSGQDQIFVLRRSRTS